jgi:hypothetical protein
MEVNIFSEHVLHDFAYVTEFDILLLKVQLIRGTQSFSCLRHYATSWKVVGSIPNEVIVYFTLPNPSSHIAALGLVQSLTHMSTRGLPGGKGQSACKADNLTSICELIV